MRRYGSLALLTTLLMATGCRVMDKPKSSALRLAAAAVRPFLSMQSTAPLTQSAFRATPAASPVPVPTVADAGLSALPKPTTEVTRGRLPFEKGLPKPQATFVMAFESARPAPIARTQLFMISGKERASLLTRARAAAAEVSKCKEQKLRTRELERGSSRRALMDLIEEEDIAFPSVEIHKVIEIHTIGS